MAITSRLRAISLIARPMVRLEHSKASDSKPTPFYDFHVANEAKFVPFCGYTLPIQYGAQSIFESHHHVRKHCGMFDVSHMLQVEITGADCFRFIESLVTANLNSLKPGTGTLSVYLNREGGIMDDVIVHSCRHEETKGPYVYAVSNAACAEKIRAHLETKQQEFTQLGHHVSVQVLEERALLAVQGPESHSVLRNGIDASHLPAFDDLHFMETQLFSSLFGFQDDKVHQSIRITRCGYTGEDGYEISLPQALAVPLANRLMELGNVKPIGLAARDTLRLEAGLCLYGNDLWEQVTPVEATLTWLIGKKRRQTADEPHFPGWQVIVNQLNKSSETKSKRVGLVGGTGPQARAGMSIFTTASDEPVGHVTSGCLSPTLGYNIAMAYVNPSVAQVGESLRVQIRNKFHPFSIATMPFVPNRYARRPKTKKN